MKKANVQMNLRINECVAYSRQDNNGMAKSKKTRQVDDNGQITKGEANKVPTGENTGYIQGLVPNRTIDISTKSRKHGRM